MKFNLRKAMFGKGILENQKGYAPIVYPLVTTGISALGQILGRKKKGKVNMPYYDPSVAPTPTYGGIEAMPEDYYTGQYEALKERTEDPYQQAIEESQRRSIAGGVRGSGIVEARVENISDARAKQLSAIQANLGSQQALRARSEKQKVTDIAYEAAMKRWAAQEQAKRGQYQAALSETELQSQSDQMADLQNQQLLASLLGLTGDVWSGYASSQTGTKAPAPTTMAKYTPTSTGQVPYNIFNPTEEFSDADYWRLQALLQNT